MMAPRSAAYTGHVVHARHRPRAHRLHYRVFYLLLDLDELDALDRGLRLFARNRRALFSFRDADHGPRNGTDLRAWVDAQLTAAGEFGATKSGRPIPFGDIPARPFLGFSPETNSEIITILNRHLATAIT